MISLCYFNCIFRTICESEHFCIGLWVIQLSTSAKGLFMPFAHFFSGDVCLFLSFQSLILVYVVEGVFFHQTCYYFMQLNVCWFFF